MAWFDEAVFYHIYPLGLAGAPHDNPWQEPVHRLRGLTPWIGHIRELGCNALYIGPLFQSGSHGYDTADYRLLDSRLGTNEDLRDFVARCHEAGIRVVLDGVFNHTGRDFFAFRDIREHRAGSPFCSWYCNVDFRGNNAYNDGFSYTNWGGHDLLVKLDQRNPEVRSYIADTIRFWVREFDIDGIRLDAADVLDHDFMHFLRQVADEIGPDFWLMGEVIHGDYTRWVGPQMLHAVTNYTLHKALWSGHNEHNYFEIAHTVRRLYDMGGRDPLGLRLYNFADNHDVERIASRLHCRTHLIPIAVLTYTLPGVPSIYYGSEFGIEGRKDRGSDWPLRPALCLEELRRGDDLLPRTLARLGQVRTGTKALSYGAYEELSLSNRQYVYARVLGDVDVIIGVNCDDGDAQVNVPARSGVYRGVLTGSTVYAQNGRAALTIPGNFGEIWLPEGAEQQEYEPLPRREEPAPAQQAAEQSREAVQVPDIPCEQMTVEQLQAGILAKMAANGPVTDYMRRTVEENRHHGSLLNWIRSFR